MQSAQTTPEAAPESERPAASRLRGFAERFVLDTSEHEPVYLLTTADGRYLRLSRSAFHLLEMMEAGTPEEEVAECFGRGSARSVTCEEVRAAYERLMERVRELDKEVDPSPLGLRFARPVIPAETVRRISAPLTGAFSWPAAFALLAVVAFGTGLYVEDLRTLNVSTLLPFFWPGYALFWLSLVAHELGHASACARFGARPADIGVGVWFIYPALYSDVTDAWRLTRWERVAVDIGGIYFQAVVGAVYVIAFQLTGWRALEAAGMFIAANCLFSLNPLFKFDGYWIISDALGVTNLKSDARRLVAVLWAWLRGRESTGVRWSRWVAVAILFFGALAAAAWGYFMVRVVPSIVRRILAYPEVAMDFGRDLVARHGMVGTDRVLAFLLTTLLTLLGARLVVDMTRRTAVRAHKAGRAALERLRPAATSGKG